MSFAWFIEQSDYLLFAAAAVGVMFGVMLVSRRWQSNRAGWPVAWLALAVILGLGWSVVERAGKRERHHIMDGVSALAPTYAAELERLGHAAIGLNTATNDPAYLEMIAAEIRWLKLNPNISDIYTMRLGADGRPYFVVDAETDYDHNGRYEGAREARTAIGEIYEEKDECLQRAFRGQAGFADEPTIDRWGTWVSAYVPMRDAQGRVEAVLGVDYAADQWLRQTAVMRRTWIGVFALLVAILAGATGVVARLRAELAVRRRNEQQLQIQAKAMESAANAIVITDPAGTIQWLNPAFTTLTGYSAAEAIGQNPRLLKSGAQDEAFYRQLWQTIAAGQVWSGQLVNRRKDGSHYAEEMTITPVRGADDKVVSYIAVKQDVTERKQVEAEREKLHRQLLDVSRQAGMAEVATSVLHNVGNVLNSVNVTTSLMADHIRESKVVNLGKAAALLRDHATDLPDFLTRDPRGQLLPAYLKELAEQIMQERIALQDELTELTQNIDHIKVIVAMQQDYGRLSGVVESLSAAELVEDALRLNEAALRRHEVEVVREYGEAPLVVAEKHKVLQILVNLIRNAKYALDDSPRLDKYLTVRVGMNGSGRVKIQVADNGVGITPENLTRIFEHGFTTRKEGHGFGLHSGVLAAQELGGVLTAQSDGPGEGAVFTLELPRQGSKGE